MINLELVNGKRINRVGFGCEQLGGYKWGKINIKSLQYAIHYGIEHYNLLFDTADCYGIGQSEKNLGNAIYKSREQVFLLTKFGVRFDKNKNVYYDNTPKYAEIALSSSLKRLKTDYIDMYLVHWPDRKTKLKDIFEKLEEFRIQGKIRYYGISNFDIKKIIDLNPTDWPGFKLFSDKFNILQNDQKDKIIKITSENKLIFLGFGVLGQGLLTKKYNSNHKFDGNDRREVNEFSSLRVDKDKLIQNYYNVLSQYKLLNPVNVAIKYALKAIPNSIMVTGIKDLEQLKLNLKSEIVDLSDELFDKINKITDSIDGD